MHSAAAMLQMLPVPVLEALRDYVQEEVKDRKGPLTSCDRSFVEHLNELIRGARLKEHRLYHGITGIVPDPEEDEKRAATVFPQRCSRRVLSSSVWPTGTSSGQAVHPVPAMQAGDCRARAPPTAALSGPIPKAPGSAGG